MSGADKVYTVKCNEKQIQYHNSTPGRCPGSCFDNDLLKGYADPQI